MTHLFDYLDAGDDIYVAWIENNECNYGWFEITNTRLNCGNYELLARKDDRDVCIAEAMAGLYVLIETDEFHDTDGPTPAYPALGIGDCADRALVKVLLSMLTLGYSPAEAVDLAFFGFTDICPAGLARIRDTPIHELEERVANLIQDVGGPSARTV